MTSADIYTFSDAFIYITNKREYGQTGIILGLLTRGKDGTGLFPVTDWCSSKQRLVSHSAYGVEILACADAEDHGYAVREMIRAMNFNKNGRHILHVDSMALYDTVSTLH